MPDEQRIAIRPAILYRTIATQTDREESDISQQGIEGKMKELAKRNEKPIEVDKPLSVTIPEQRPILEMADLVANLRMAIRNSPRALQLELQTIPIAIIEKLERLILDVKVNENGRASDPHSGSSENSPRSWTIRRVFLLVDTGTQTDFPLSHNLTSTIDYAARAGESSATITQSYRRITTTKSSRTIGP
jgi:hypothetical protein